MKHTLYLILDSLVVSVPACHAKGQGSIPRQGDLKKIYDIESKIAFKTLQNFVSNFTFYVKKVFLPNWELNPSHMRDRREYLPLDYQELDIGQASTKAGISSLIV